MKPELLALVAAIRLTKNNGHHDGMGNPVIGVDLYQKAALVACDEVERLSKSIKELQAEVEQLRNQIGELAKVLLAEFGGPTQSESACEMAVRVLREQKAEAEE